MVVEARVLVRGTDLVRGPGFTSAAAAARLRNGHALLGGGGRVGRVFFLFFSCLCSCVLVCVCVCLVSWLVG